MLAKVYSERDGLRTSTSGKGILLLWGLILVKLTICGWADTLSLAMTTCALTMTTCDHMGVNKQEKQRNTMEASPDCLSLRASGPGQGGGHIYMRQRESGLLYQEDALPHTLNVLPDANVVGSRFAFVVGRIIPPKDNDVLIPIMSECVTLQGQREFADVVKLTTLRWGDYPALFSRV